MSRHVCEQCGAPIEVYVSSVGGTYAECSATMGSGSHEFVIKALRDHINNLESNPPDALRIEHERDASIRAYRIYIYTDKGGYELRLKDDASLEIHSSWRN